MKTQYDRMKENNLMQVELLGYILNDAKVYYKCLDMIKPEMFTGINRQIFDGFVKCTVDGITPDAILISDRSNIPLEEIIKVATYYSGSPIPVEGLIAELFGYMANEKLSHLAGYISSQITAGTDHEAIISRINTVLAEIQIGNTSSLINMQDAVMRLSKIIENNIKSEHQFSGTPTGIKIVDYHMGGFHPGDLVIIAGETSHGKTSLALSMMFRSSVYYEVPVGIISHEMTPEQITGRLAAYATEISSKHLLFGKLSDAELALFMNRVNTLIRSKIFIQDFIKRDLSETIASIRLMVMKHSVKYVVVENAGNINVKGKMDDESRTAEISKSLKSIALELNITVILISHLAREKDGRKVQPTLNRLRHSGQLEQDADVVIFVYYALLHGYQHFCDESDADGISTDGKIKVYIAKGRNVGTAQSYMNFNEQLTLFSDATEPEYKF